MDMEISARSLRTYKSKDIEDGIGGKYSSMDPEYKSSLRSAILGVEAMGEDEGKGHRVLSFKDKPPAPLRDKVNNLSILYSWSSGASNVPKVSYKLASHHIAPALVRILDALDLLDDWHTERVGSLAWNRNIFPSSDRDGIVFGIYLAQLPHLGLDTRLQITKLLLRLLHGLRMKETY